MQDANYYNANPSSKTQKPRKFTEESYFFMRDEDSRKGRFYINENSPSTFSQDDEEDFARDPTLFLNDGKPDTFSIDGETNLELNPISMIESFNQRISNIHGRKLLEKAFESLAYHTCYS